ncbi:MAG: sulfatase [Planctomycetota bacterium]|jgi:arylsulfatase A-like enzyme
MRLRFKALFLTFLFSLPTLSQDRPNIVFVLADDLGWAELGCYGNTFNETPHLDRLATQGVRFTQAYAAAPVCSPYRASFITGQYPARVGITDYMRPNDPRPLHTQHFTLAEALKREGYATAIVGKWHLSGYETHNATVVTPPGAHGFDETLCNEIKGVGNGINFWPYVGVKPGAFRWLNIDENRLGPDEYLMDRMAYETAQFIRRNKDRPFFVYLSHFATHSIVQGKPDLVEKYRRKHKPGPTLRTAKCRICDEQGLQGDPQNHWASGYNPHLAAMLESIDDGVGLILNTLDELGLADNTIVVFTSDNGGEGAVQSATPLRGAKSMLYEGGIREPLIVRWPGVTPPNTVSDALTTSVDFYPTFLEAASIRPNPDQHLDGVSILPVLKNPQAQLDRDTLYWHYPLFKPHFLGGRSSGAVRHGDWKLIEFFDTGLFELYNLADDMGEQNNLADQNPQKVKELQNLLKDWRKDVAALIYPVKQ